MKHSVIEMTRAVRRRLERVVRNSREKDHARRALAVLHLWETQGNVAEVAHRVRAARSSGVLNVLLPIWYTLAETARKGCTKGFSMNYLSVFPLCCLNNVREETACCYCLSAWNQTVT